MDILVLRGHPALIPSLGANGDRRSISGARHRPAGPAIGRVCGKYLGDTFRFQQVALCKDCSQAPTGGGAAMQAAARLHEGWRTPNMGFPGRQARLVSKHRPRTGQRRAPSRKRRPYASSTSVPGASGRAGCSRPSSGNWNPYALVLEPAERAAADIGAPRPGERRGRWRYEPHGRFDTQCGHSAQQRLLLGFKSVIMPSRSQCVRTRLSRGAPPRGAD